MTNFAHQSITDIHLTPPCVIEIARAVMGEITLDPCTSSSINAWSVKALDYFEEKGLEKLNDARLSSIELGNVWCNPPGGKIGNQSNMKLWLETIYELWMDGTIDQAFFLFFNREFIGGTDKVDLSQVPMLHFKERLKYWSWNEVDGCFKEGNWSGQGGNRKWTNSPTHPSSLVYFPPRNNAEWSEKIALLPTVTPVSMGRWVIPSMPTDLGAK